MYSMKNKLKIPSALQWAWQRCAVVMLCMVCSLLFIFSGCKKEDGFISMTVYDTPTYSVQFGVNYSEVDIKCNMVAKEKGSTNELNLELSSIKNFTYEKGYEYLLKVKRTSEDNYLYSLEEIVSKSLMYEPETVILSVSSELAPIGPDEELIEVMVIQEEGIYHSDRYFAKIEGFDYETGFDFQLKVQKTVIPMPVTSGMNSFPIFTLIKIISKTSKIQ